MFKNHTSSKIAVENLTEAQKKKYKHFDNNNYLKQLKNFHEMNEAKAKSINFRNKLLETKDGKLSKRSPKTQRCYESN